MKNILIVSDTFYPNKTSGAKLLFDLTNELKKKNKILVICAQNSNLIEFFKKLNISSQKKNLKIVFVPSLFIKNKNLFIRGLFEFIMGFIVWHKAKNHINNFKPSSLVVYSPSIFFGYLTKKINKKFRTKSLCIMRDLFPYWAIEVGYINNFFFKLIFKNILNKFIYSFDSIGLEANTNIKILSKLNKKNKKKFFFLPNWIDIEDFKYQRLKIKKKMNFLFGGNFGGGQDLEKVLKFFKKINYDYCKMFYLIGDGISASSISNFLETNISKKIIYRNKMSQLKYFEFIEKIDFGIISLNDKISSVNFPGRLYSYLLKNKPVIILSSKKNELSEFVEKNKIGLRYSEKMNLNTFMKKLNKISINIDKNKNHIKNILKKNFSVKKIGKLLISKI